MVVAGDTVPSTLSAAIASTLSDNRLLTVAPIELKASTMPTALPPPEPPTVTALLVVAAMVSVLVATTATSPVLVMTELSRICASALPITSLVVIVLLMASTVLATPCGSVGGGLPKIEPPDADAVASVEAVMLALSVAVTATEPPVRSVEST